MGAGLRTKTKVMETMPPDPKIGAPVLYSTGESSRLDFSIHLVFPIFQTGKEWLGKGTDVNESDFLCLAAVHTGR